MLSLEKSLEIISTFSNNTIVDFENFLKDEGDQFSNNILSEYDTRYTSEGVEYIESKNNRVEVVESYHPYDSGTMFKIFKVIDKLNNEYSYLRFEGRYSSWCSSHWYKVELVQPTEVSVTSFVTIFETI